MREVIGYQRIFEVAEGQVATAAPITCASCGKWLSGMGGPRRDVLCMLCLLKEPHLQQSQQECGK